jgi:hypothetical protein
MSLIARDTGSVQNVALENTEFSALGKGAVSSVLQEIR